MVREFSKSVLIEEIKKNKLIILDFYAVWCGPCKNFEKIFEEVANEMNSSASFGKINIDEHRDLAIEYKVSSIPTLLIIKDGNLVWSHVGVLDALTLKNKITFLLK